MADGKRIFVNKLKFYPNGALPEDQMLTFQQIAYKDLKILKNADQRSLPVEVKCAILQTMIFEPELIKHLLGARIPLTVFSDRNKAE